MMTPPRVLTGMLRAPPAAVLALLLVPALAGCFGGGDEPIPVGDDSDLDPAGNRTFADNATLPDGRGESAGLKETNVTEEGVGGVEHKHDYWNGAESVTLFQRNVGLSFLPFFPNGEGSNPASVGYVKLPEGMLVYEGADRVSVLVASPTVRGAANPSPPAVMMQVRTAVDSDWRDAEAVTFDAPMEVAVSPQETDMPHSTHSLWMWRFTADNGYLQSLNVTITAHRGRDVVDWPGHPDFYATSAERVVFDGESDAVMKAFPDNSMYEDDDWAHPDKLISHGTGLLRVWANITSFSSRTGAPATHFYLNYHNASEGDFEAIFNEVADARGENNLESYYFEVPVDHGGMDGPYQPQSRWGFRLEAAVGGVAPVGGIPFLSGGCGDCDAYEMTYTLKIVAVRADEVAPLG